MRDRYRTRKGIKFWIERLIINLAEELGFSSISVPISPKSLREWGNNCSGYFLLKWGLVLPNLGNGHRVGNNFMFQA